LYKDGYLQAKLLLLAIQHGQECLILLRYLQGLCVGFRSLRGCVTPHFRFKLWGICWQGPIYATSLKTCFFVHRFLWL